jgi:hypothetical protein
MRFAIAPQSGDLVFVDEAHSLTETLPAHGVTSLVLYRPKKPADLISSRRFPVGIGLILRPFDTPRLAKDNARPRGKVAQLVRARHS